MHHLTRGEQKSLAYHQAVAEKLRLHPEQRAIAQRRLSWYRERNPSGKVYYDRWEGLLAGPMDELIAAMLDLSDVGCSLRQENPFVDLIDQRERAAIYRAVAERIDSATPA
jgi:hypothetical protein